MKNLILIIGLSAALYSCSVTNKNVGKFKTGTDSISVTNTHVVEVKKKDSAGTNTTVTTTTKTTDEGYKETTVIREYFGDEFDFFPEMENDYEGAPVKDEKKKVAAAKDTAKTSGPKLVYRETTKTTEGTKKTDETQAKTEDKKTKVSFYDSIANEAAKITDVKTTATATVIQKEKTQLFPWYVWAFAGVFLLAMCSQFFRAR